MVKIIVFAVMAIGMVSLWNQPLPESIVSPVELSGLTLFSRKSNDLSKKVKELERQMIVLKKDQRPVGYDHIQRLWKELLGLWEKGALSRAKAMELYQLLTDVYWMSNPKPAVQKSSTHADTKRDSQNAETDKKTEQGKTGSAESDIETQTRSIQQEIENIAKTPGTENGISEEHYNRLKKQLDYLAGKGVTGLEKYYNIIEGRNPYAVAEADKKNQAALAEEKKRRENPYYDCPVDTAPPTLNVDFTDFSSIKMITPPGTLTGDRDVAKGHFWIWTDGVRAPLYVPVDAVFESMTSGPASASDKTIHYTLNFKVKDPCGFKFRFAHVTEPDTSLKPGDVLSAGSRVAYTIGNIPSGNWDIGFYNMLKEGELAKINAYGLHRHGVCLIDYYPLEKRQAYRALFDQNGPRRVCQY